MMIHNRSMPDPCTLAFIEFWKDQDAIDFYNASEHFQRILSLLGAMCLKLPEVDLEFPQELFGLPLAFIRDFSRLNDIIP